jgi:hypothetical protein
LALQVGGHVGAFKDLGDKIHKLVMDQPELVFYKKINQAREEGNDALAWPTKFSAVQNHLLHLLHVVCLCVCVCVYVCMCVCERACLGGRVREGI